MHVGERELVSLRVAVRDGSVRLRVTVDEKVGDRLLVPVADMDCVLEALAEIDPVREKLDVPEAEVVVVTEPVWVKEVGRDPDEVKVSEALQLGLSLELRVGDRLLVVLKLPEHVDVELSVNEPLFVMLELSVVSAATPRDSVRLLLSETVRLLLELLDVVHDRLLVLV